MKLSGMVNSAKLVSDQWLSDLLQKPAYNLKGDSRTFTSSQFPKGEAFIGAKVPVEDVSGLIQLQSMNFNVIDTNLQFKRPPLSLEESNIKTRFATLEDSEAVQMIAREEFVYNRFHRDPEIDNNIASRIKQEWVVNFFAGKRGEWMVVIEDDQGIGGFLLLLNDELEGNLIIDLIAVAKRCRNKGFAYSMVAFALNECLENTVAIKVGTQISNLSSISFYIGLGFKMTSASNVLHLHLKI
jgi:GNAT superfamily N-acetyltransferase